MAKTVFLCTKSAYIYPMPYTPASDDLPDGISVSSSCGTTPILKAAWRHLSAHEIALIPQSFASQIDIHAVRLIDRAHNPLAAGRIVCRGNDIYWKAYPKDFSLCSIGIQALLIHELCHVWQYSHGKLTALRYLCNPRAWKYGYEFSSLKCFAEYPTEQQADLLQDWYAVHCGLRPSRYCRMASPPSTAQIKAVVPFTFDPAFINQSVPKLSSSLTLST